MNPHLIVKLPIMGVVLSALAACGSIQPEPKPVKIVVQGKAFSNCSQVGLSFVCKQPAAPKPAPAAEPAEIAQASLPEPEAGNQNQPLPEGEAELVAAVEAKTDPAPAPAPAPEPAQTSAQTLEAKQAAGGEAFAEAKGAPDAKAKSSPVAVAVPQQLNLVSSLQVGTPAQAPQPETVAEAAPQEHQEPAAGKTDMPAQAKEKKTEPEAKAESKQATAPDAEARINRTDKGSDLKVAATLDQFVEELRRDVEAFRADWMKKHSKAPDKYPIEMAGASEDVWLMKFLNFHANRHGE